MRYRVGLAGLALMATGATAQTVTTDPSGNSVTAAMRALPVHVGGRVVRTPLAGMPPGAFSYRHEWPGVYFEAAFTGTRVVLKFDDPRNEYRLLIDDRPQPIAVPQPGRADIIVAGLPVGRHRVRLEKVTESIGLPERFEGFYVDRDARPGVVRPRRRMIEFVGPSGMTGYGDRSAKRTCDLEEVRLSTDTQQAFTALVAKHYDADYQINAISGRGLIRNLEGARQAPGLARAYDYALPDDRQPYRDPRWKPRIVVLQVMVDFVGNLTPDERWGSIEALASDYVATLGSFLATLHRRSRDVTVVMSWADPATQPDPEARRLLIEGRRRIEEAAHRAGIKTIDFMVTPDIATQWDGCNGHPGVAQHRMIADWMIGYIDRHPAWWRRR